MVEIVQSTPTYRVYWLKDSTIIIYRHIKNLSQLSSISVLDQNDDKTPVIVLAGGEDSMHAIKYIDKYIVQGMQIFLKLHMIPLTN